MRQAHINTTKGLELAMLIFNIWLDSAVSLPSIRETKAGSNHLSFFLIINPQITVIVKAKIFFPAHMYSG